LNPLLKVREAFQNGILPKKEYSLIVKRFPNVVSGISRIEKASGVDFPIAYVEPSITISSSGTNSFEYGILFARTIPVVAKNTLEVVIQISAPLVAYGLKGTIHAILAHEFLHYLELMRKISNMELISDETSANLFENVYADSERLFEPRAVFSDKTLLLHITKKFPSGFRDYKLEDKVIKYWIEKNLPVTNITLDTNITKLSSDLISKYNDVDLPEGRFVTHLIRSRLTYAISPEMYIQSLLQYNNQSDQWSMNWRFIWQQSAATGLYIVYNQTQDYDGIPIASSTKSFVVKYSYLFDVLN